MTNPPVPPLNPEKLRAERNDVDLGSAETGFDKVQERSADERDAGLDETTAGILPPAR